MKEGFLKRPPELLAIFMGLGAIFFFVTVVSYYWKGATKWGAICTVLFSTLATLGVAGPCLDADLL